MEVTGSARTFDPRSITRPDRALLIYYALVSALTLVAFPIVFLVHYVKYRTLRYGLDDEGISMSWGFLSRKEIYLTYRRIQDIHVTRDWLQRWLGIADVAVQTAGGSGEEITIVGVREPDALRDFLYANMRGGRAPVGAPPPADEPSRPDEVTELLRDIRDSLRALRARADRSEPR